MKFVCCDFTMEDIKINLGMSTEGMKATQPRYWDEIGYENGRYIGHKTRKFSL